jgi:hypothetical protein
MREIWIHPNDYGKLLRAFFDKKEKANVNFSEDDVSLIKYCGIPVMVSCHLDEIAIEEGHPLLIERL